jgi:hypothetical protein
METKKAFMLLFKSTLTVTFISLLLGIGASIVGASFWAVFVLSVALQYVLFAFIGGIVNNYLTQKTKLKEIEKLEQLSSILECSYCKQKNVITFIPDENERLEFDCMACNKTNVVNIHFTVARITEPAIPLPTLKELSTEE